MTLPVWKLTRTTVGRRVFDALADAVVSLVLTDSLARYWSQKDWYWWTVNYARYLREAQDPFYFISFAV